MSTLRDLALLSNTARRHYLKQYILYKGKSQVIKELIVLNKIIDNVRDRKISDSLYSLIKDLNEIL